MPARLSLISRGSSTSRERTHPDELPSSAASEAGKKEFLAGLESLIDALRSRVLKDRNALEEYVWLGRLFRIRGEPRRALRLHQRLLARPLLTRQMETVVYAEIGFDSFDARLGDFGEGAFRKAISIWKHNVPAIEGLVRLYETREEWTEAAKWLQQLIRFGRPEASHLSYVQAAIAVVQLGTGDIGGARRSVNRALRADPNSLYAQLVLADLFLEAGRFQKTIALLREFVRRYPTHSFLALRRMEDAHYRMNTFPAYESTLRDCLRDSPDNFYLHYSLARHLNKKRRKDEALDALRRALELNPLYINAVRDRCQLLAEREHAVESAEEAQRFFAAFKRSRRFICPNCRQRYVPITWFCNRCIHWGIFDVRYELPAP